MPFSSIFDRFLVPKHPIFKAKSPKEGHQWLHYTCGLTSHWQKALWCPSIPPCDQKTAEKNAKKPQNPSNVHQHPEAKHGPYLGLQGSRLGTGAALQLTGSPEPFPPPTPLTRTANLGSLYWGLELRPPPCMKKRYETRDCTPQTSISILPMAENKSPSWGTTLTSQHTPRFLPHNQNSTNSHSWLPPALLTSASFFASLSSPRWTNPSPPLPFRARSSPPPSMGMSTVYHSPLIPSASKTFRPGAATLSECLFFFRFHHYFFAAGIG